MRIDHLLASNFHMKDYDILVDIMNFVEQNQLFHTV